MIGYLAGVATGIAMVLGVITAAHLDGIRRNRAQHAAEETRCAQ